MWLDSHCHVTADRFDADREEVLERARQAGVETLIAIGSGYGIEGSRAAVELARDREDCLEQRLIEGLSAGRVAVLAGHFDRASHPHLDRLDRGRGPGRKRDPNPREDR